MNDLGARRPDLIGFEVAYARRRNRVTVGFRLILAIPQLIVVAFLGIAAYVVLVIGWSGALFIGRMPRWAAEFLAGYVGWNSRVYAYVLMLVDAYPPFEMLAPPSYPIRVIIPPPGQLNRAAVFFRLILAIPAYIVNGIAVSGLSTVSVLIWLYLVVGGRMPRQLFLAMTSITRFYLRFFAYFALLTPAYPSGLFAEPVSIGDSGGPGAGSFDAGSPGGYGPAWPAVPTRLPGGAKVIIAVLLVVGLAADIVDYASQGSNGLGVGVSFALAYSRLTVAHTQFVSADEQAQSELSGCQAHDPALGCVEQAYSTEGSAYSSFASSLQLINFPRGAHGDGSSLLDEVQLAGERFQVVAGASSQSDFNAEVAQGDLKTLTQTIGQHYTRLSKLLKTKFP